MNPSSKGWLKEYLSYYLTSIESDNKEQFSEDSIYKMISSSSLLFSIPIKQSESLHPDFQKWNLKEKIKIIFAEHLFRISDAYIKTHKFALKTSDVYERFSELSEEENSTELFINKILIGKKDTLLLNAYNINPWAFLYLIEFYYFLKTETFDRQKIKLNIIKGMFKAAKANDDISKKEARLLKRVIENGDFTKSEKESIYKYSEVKITETNFTQTKTLIKKITYDFALLALMTDKTIDEAELIFVNQYADLLDISLKEQYQTFSIIQDIHLNHYQQIPHLHKSYSVKSMQSVVSHNFKYVLKKNLSMIVNEISESKELVQLLRKSTDKRLSNEEKAKVKEQILDLLKTIPSLTIFMIPGGSILLPILMKILPEELIFPSSFINKNKDS